MKKLMFHEFIKYRADEYEPALLRPELREMHQKNNCIDLTVSGSWISNHRMMYEVWSRKGINSELLLLTRIVTKKYKKYAGNRIVSYLCHEACHKFL